MTPSPLASLPRRFPPRPELFAQWLDLYIATNEFCQLKLGFFPLFLFAS